MPEFPAIKRFKRMVNLIMRFRSGPKEGAEGLRIDL